MNRTEYVKAIATATDFTQKDVKAVLDAAQTVAYETMAKEEEVAIFEGLKLVGVKKAACVGIIAVIISKGYYHVLSLVLVPIFDVALEFINLSSSSPMCSPSTTAGIFGFTGNPTTGFSGSGGLPLSVGESIVCAVESMESKIYMIFAYGQWAFCRGIHVDGLFILGLIPNPIYIIDGIILYVGGILFLIGYPWVIADALLQMGIAMALMPFAVCGFAFSGTKSYLTKLFSWVLNSMFNFLFMGILITCIVAYVESIINAAINNTRSSSLFVDPIGGLAFYGTNMLIIIFVLVIGYIYMPSIKDLAGCFAAGSSVSGSKNIETFARNQGNKFANFAAKTTGKAINHVGSNIKRGTKSAARKGMTMAVNRFGKDDGHGNKSMKLLWAKYSTQKSADGKSVLQREVNLFGKRRIRVYDKYSTIKQTYDKNGNLIGSNVKFNHNFMNKYLFDERGNINKGALEAILNSPLAKADPQFAEAIVARVAIEALNKKGVKVGKHFKSRDIKFDPKNPNKIIINQVDHAGKSTSILFEYDPKTGRTAVGAKVSRKRTDPMKRRKLRRKNKAIDKKSNGRGAYTSWLGTEYQKYVDPDTGEEGYIKRRKKFLFFGDTIEEKHTETKVVERVIKRQSYQNKVQTELNEKKPSTFLGKAYHGTKNTVSWIAGVPLALVKSTSSAITHPVRTLKKLAHPVDAFKDMGQGIKDYTNKKFNGEANSYGGRTKVGLFHVNETRVDANGNVTYHRRLRSGFKLKNYWRTGKSVVKTAVGVPLKLGKTVLKTVAYPIVHPVKTVRGIFHPKSSLKAMGSYYANSFSDYKESVRDEFGRSWQKGDETTFDETITKDIYGNVSKTNNATGEVTRVTQGEVKGEEEWFFDNGMVQFKGKSTINGDDEKSGIVTFSYSKEAQEDHDSFKEDSEHDQIVRSNGTISDKLDVNQGAKAEMDLLMGMEDFELIVTPKNGKSFKDFAVHDILAEGHRRKTAKIKVRDKI